MERHSRDGTCGHLRSVLDGRSSFIISEGFSFQEATALSPEDHISVKSSSVTAKLLLLLSARWRQQNTPTSKHAGSDEAPCGFSSNARRRPRDRVRPHQLSITFNGGGEIELKQSHGWPEDTGEILFLAAAFYSFIIDVKVMGLQSRANDQRQPLCKIDERCAIMGWTHERRGHAANDSLETSIARQAESQKARSPF